MELKLYKTDDDVNVINKTLTNEQKLTVILKRDIDIVNPVIILKAPSGIDLQEYNYLKITDLKRSYVVENIEVVAYQVFKLSCITDVLETYKTDILNSDCLYKRNIETGDFTHIDVNWGNNTIINTLYSDKTLTGDTMLLSVIQGGS